MVKHVYILGAGFSRPLGGPLFNNLLTMEYWRSHSDIRLAPEMRDCIDLLHRTGNRSIDESLGLSNRLNAEDLIALLEWCYLNPESVRSKLVYDSFAVVPAKIKYLHNAGVFLREVYTTLKRVVACQCNTFTQHLEAGTDLIAPYVSWLKSLTSNDTIITFNYDTAIEAIAQTCGVNIPKDFSCHETTGPRLMHVHGCVNWVLGIDDKITYCEYAYMDNVNLSIGLPGFAKARITENGQMFSLWKSMKNALSDADVISILGYSMPATDNMARQAILDSLRSGQRVNIVVGNDSFTSGRMQSLIQPIVGTNSLGVSRVVDLKMYAQDYLSNVDRYLMYDFSTKTFR